jgi:hypothetical protein
MQVVRVLSRHMRFLRHISRGMRGTKVVLREGIKVVLPGVISREEVDMMQGIKVVDMDKEVSKKGVGGSGVRVVGRDGNYDEWKWDRGLSLSYVVGFNSSQDGYGRYF